MDAVEAVEHPANTIMELEKTKFVDAFLNLTKPKLLKKKLPAELTAVFKDLSKKEILHAIDAAYDAYHAYMDDVKNQGARIIEEARKQKKHIIVLAGRPYHVDPEVNHGIDQLIVNQGAAVITEDSISYKVPKFATNVLNQWMYHSRLYAAAKYCTSQEDMDLIQLVSFGCGLDAITTDETRAILKDGGKLYTQLKIDEITNLGAVNIRIRSLFAALEERKTSGGTH